MTSKAKITYYAMEKTEHFILFKCFIKVKNLQVNKAI